MSSNKTQVTKDFAAKSIFIAREFAAPVEDVWRAFTEAELLDQWWGPQPWRAETSHMDFTVGGHWLYAMVGPEGERHWGRMNYLDIVVHDHYDLEDGFCDENGTMNPALPVSQGTMRFTKTATGTRVDMKTIYPSEADLQTVVEMGFEQGISICLDQLEAMLAKKRG